MKRVGGVCLGGVLDVRDGCKGMDEDAQEVACELLLTIDQYNCSMFCLVLVPAWPAVEAATS